MRRLFVLVGLIGFLIWRGKRLDAYDREHRMGAWADVPSTS